MWYDAQAKTFELDAHRQHEVRQQHCHLERNELIEAQSVRAGGLVAKPRARLRAGQGRIGYEVGDILVS
jgi:hypothetical protein